ncbi:MAG: DedA family protein [Prevotella sp.]|nr:DedA family protein [Prevotella sp.]
MQSIIDFLIGYGCWGMFLAAFMAGSFFPFSSEAVMIALFAAGVDPLELVIWGTAGNVAGGMFNYAIGRMGKMEWIEKHMHVKKEKLERTQRFMSGHGAWMGFFAFVPILGSAITIVLGLMRANILISIISITLGKLLRYALLIYGTNAVIN